MMAVCSAEEKDCLWNYDKHRVVQLYLGWKKTWSWYNQNNLYTDWLVCKYEDFSKQNFIPLKIDEYISVSLKTCVKYVLPVL